MNLNQVKCFVALANSCNFTQAAQELFVTQPAFSRMIASLEDELNVQLFVRSKREPHLTEMGAQLLPYFQSILSAYNNIRSKADSGQGGVTGSLSIGFMHNALTGCVPEIFRSFRAQYPNISLTLKAMDDNEASIALEHGNVDIGIFTPMSYEGKDNLDHLITNVAHHCVVVYADHPLAERSSVFASELKDEKIICISPRVSSAGYQFLYQLCLQNGFVPQIAAEADSISSMIAYVDCQAGIAVATDALSPLSSPTIRFIPIEGTPPFKQMIIWKKSNANPCLERFIQCANQCIP